MAKLPFPNPRAWEVCRAPHATRGQEAARAVARAVASGVAAAAEAEKGARGAGGPGMNVRDPNSLKTPFIRFLFFTFFLVF